VPGKVGNIFQTAHTLFDARTNILLTQYINKSEGHSSIERLFEPRGEVLLRRQQHDEWKRQERDQLKTALKAERKQQKESAVAAAGKGNWRERMEQADSKIRSIAAQRQGHGSTHEDRLTFLLSMGLKNKEKYIYQKKKKKREKGQGMSNSSSSSWKELQSSYDTTVGASFSPKYDTFRGSSSRPEQPQLPARLLATIGTKQQRHVRRHRQLAKYTVDSCNAAWVMPISGK
jgi:hypothetical protein